MAYEELNVTLTKAGYRWAELREPKEFEVEPAIRREYPVCTKDTLVGVEIEIENFLGVEDEHKLDMIWYTKEDGSLRDDGIEWVSYAMPAAKIPQAIHMLYTNLKEGWRFSERCGIHFHLNFRKKKLMDVLNMGVLYLPFEKLLYRLAGEQRYKSIFAVPLQETQTPDLLAEYLQNANLRQFCNNWDKYSGLNFLPLMAYGSVEARHMSGTKDIHEIVDFLNVLLAIRKYASDHSFEHIWHEIQPLNNNSQYEWFVQKVLGDWARPLYRQLGVNFSREMEDGVAAAKMVQPPSSFCTGLIESISTKSDLLSKLKVREKKEPQKYTVKYAEPAIGGMWDAPPRPQRVADRILAAVDRLNAMGRPDLAQEVQREHPDLAEGLIRQLEEPDDEDEDLGNPNNDGDRW